MEISITQVDAFTDRPFAGNPAAICVLPSPKDDEWLQNVAMEMNLAETAFLLPLGQKGAYSLRWFTPLHEVDLCGHGTLSAAHVLWTEGHLNEDVEPQFQTRSGLLSAKKDGTWIELDFPAIAQERMEIPPALAQAVGGAPTYAGKARYKYLLELESERQVRALELDFSLLRNLPIKSLIVTAKSQSPDFDFVSRFFDFQEGIVEDPVTGSAHCILAPYWQRKLGKSELIGYQASRRGGAVRVTLKGDRALLRGQAVTVLKGKLKGI